MSILPSKSNGFYLNANAFKALSAEDQLQKQRQYVPNPQETAPRGDNLCNTQRVIRKRDAKRTIEWALRELIQNTGDHCEGGIDMGKPGSVWYPVPHNDDILCIGKNFKAVVTVAMHRADDGRCEKFTIYQFGRPLSRGALGQGTQAKTAQSYKGGFGDGFKSAMEVLLCHGLTGRFDFFHFQPPNRDRRYHSVSWDFVAEEYLSEEYMFVKLACSLDANNAVACGGCPIMATTVSMPLQPRSHRGTRTWMQLQETFACSATNALSDFEFLYKPISLADSVCGLALDDRWVRRDALQPLVPSFAGVTIDVGTNGLFCFKGLFYPSPKGYIGDNTIVFLPGKGMKDDADAYITWTQHRAVFKNHFRDIDHHGATYRVTDQAYRFLTADPAVRNKAAIVFQRLLRPAAQLSVEDRSVFLTGFGKGTPVAFGFNQPPLRPRLTTIAREIKRHLLLSRNVADAGTADDADLDATPFIAHDYGKAVYIMGLLSNRPRPVIRIDDLNAIDTNLFELSTVGMLKDKLQCLESPANCYELSGCYAAVVKYLLGERARVWIHRAECRDADAEPHPIRFQRTDAIVSTEPTESADGLSKFMAEMAETVEEKQKMSKLVAAFADADYENERRSFADTLSRAMRLVSGEDTLTDMDRARIAINRMSPEVRSRFFLENQAPSPHDSPHDSSSRDSFVHISPHDFSHDAPRDSHDSPPHHPSLRDATIIPRIRPRSPSPGMRRVRPRVDVRTVHIVPVNETRPEDYELDPPPTRDLDQQWNDEVELYTPDGTPPQASADVVQQHKSLLYEVMDLVEAHMPQMRMDRVRITWSPYADWVGLHEADGTIYMNIALLPQSRAKYIGTLFHEVAHDATHAHDKTWGMTMQHLFERLLVNAEFA